ncbi:hypothetical protein [Tistrella mobilis]
MVNLDAISPDAMKIAGECLRATVKGPFFPDWEFQTLIGVERNVAKILLDAWPKQSLDDVEFYCAVMASMTNLLGYPHGDDEIWSDYISCPPHRVRDVIEEFKAVDL